MKYCAYLFIVLFTLCSCGDEYLRKRVNTLEKEVDTLPYTREWRGTLGLEI